MGKSVRFGHIAPNAKETIKTTASGMNIPRSQQKISKGFSHDLGGGLSPVNMPVGGIFTLSEAEETEYDYDLSLHTKSDHFAAVMLHGGVTYRVEQWLDVQKVKIRGKDVNVETCVEFFRATYVPPDGAASVSWYDPAPLSENVERRGGVNWYRPKSNEKSAMLSWLIPRSITIKHDGEVVEELHHAK